MGLLRMIWDKRAKDFKMTKRNKRSKEDFKSFLDESKEELKKFGENKGPKYVREPWMLRGGRALENTMEVEVENDQGGN
mgnify:CR=1 FL=1